jgi:transcriptional regulator with XRE-family HTH domain
MPRTTPPRPTTSSKPAKAPSKAPVAGRTKYARGPLVAKATRNRAASLGHLVGHLVRPKFDVVGLRKGLGLSQEELGRVTGYSTRSIAGWESGDRVSSPAEHKLREVQRLQTELVKIMPREKLGEWLRTPGRAFEGQTPIQVMERGETDRIWQMIFQIRENVAN